MVLESDTFDFIYEIYYDSGEYDLNYDFMNKHNLRFVFKLKNPTLVVGQDSRLTKDTLVKLISIEVM